MENRGTGLTSRRPHGWEHQSFIGLTGHESPQGPSQTSKPTTRSMQGVIPGCIVDAIASTPSNFINQIIAGRPGMSKERSMPGDDSNIVKAGLGTAGGFPPSGEGTGKGMTSKGGIVGSAMGGTHIGGGKGGF